MKADLSMDALVEGLLAEAGQRLQERSEGEAVCRYTRAGVAVPALKFAEGQWAALRQVQQSLRNGSPPAAALTTVVDQWTVDLARRRARGAGLDWISYRTGGLEALEQLGDAFGEAGVRPVAGRPRSLVPALAGSPRMTGGPRSAPCA